MTQEEIDNWVIAYMEGTLDAGERDFVRKQLKADTQWQLALQRFQRTRQKPDSQITFPWKEQLYKTEPRLSLNKSLTGMSVVAFLCILWGIKTYYPVYQEKAGLEKQINTQKHIKETDKKHVTPAGMAFDVGAILNSKGDTVSGAEQSGSKTVHSKTKVKKPREKTLASSQKKDEQLKTSEEQWVKFSPKTAGTLKIGSAETSPEAPVIENLPRTYAFNEDKNKGNQSAEADSNANEVEEFQQKSLLEKAVAKVFNVELKRNQVQNSNEENRKSLQIQTNPLVIRAKIQFN